MEFIRRELTEEDVNIAFKLNGGGAMRLGPAQITDDSEMAMSIIHGLLDRHRASLKDKDVLTEDISG